MYYKLLGRDSGRARLEIIDESRIEGEGNPKGTDFRIIGKTDGPSRVPYGGDGGPVIEVTDEELEALNRGEGELVALPQPGTLGNNSRASHALVLASRDIQIDDEPEAEPEAEPETTAKTEAGPARAGRTKKEKPE